MQQKSNKKTRNKWFSKSNFAKAIKTKIAF